MEIRGGPAAVIGDAPDEADGQPLARLSGTGRRQERMIRKPEDLLNEPGIREPNGKGFRRTVEGPSVGTFFVFHRLLYGKEEA